VQSVGEGFAVVLPRQQAEAHAIGEDAGVNQHLAGGELGVGHETAQVGL